MVRSAVGRRLTEQPLRNLGAIGAGVLLVATSAFGGLEPVEVEGPATFTAGQEVSAAPLEVTVHRVTWVEGELPGVWATTERSRWIGVVTTVRTEHDRSLLGEPAATVALRGVDGLVGRTAPGTDAVLSGDQLLMADSSRLSPMQPGLEYEVVFLFEQDAGSPPPTEAEVVLLGHRWREDSLLGGFAWLDPTPVAAATLPARPGPGEDGSDA